MPTYTITISPQPASIPVNSTVTFTATTNDPGGMVLWELAGQLDNPTANMGSPGGGSGMTFTYTAPPTPPIYQDTRVPAGSVDIEAFLPGNVATLIIAITASNITTGVTSTASAVPLGKTQIIWGYAVGSTNNAILMQVNGTTGGSTAYGTITPASGIYGEYTYTAPATMPATGNTVTVTVISQADPTKSSSMTLTLTTS